MQINSSKPLVIMLMGPTASGKTDVAMALSKVLPIDIVSVDSTLVYRGLNIGSAKPTPEELALFPHKLIDICDPAEPYCAANFCRDAEREISAIVSASRIPILVGGSMMYFKSLLDGLADMPATDPAVRQAIAIEAAEIGWPAMHEQLKAVDPEYAGKLHPNHSQRISRALEVFRGSGITMTQ
jgi:tRNA dimethylallyltransferase